MGSTCCIYTKNSNDNIIEHTLDIDKLKIKTNTNTKTKIINITQDNQNKENKKINQNKENKENNQNPRNSNIINDILLVEKFPIFENLDNEIYNENENSISKTLDFDETRNNSIIDKSIIDKSNIDKDKDTQTIEKNKIKKKSRFWKE